MAVSNPLNDLDLREKAAMIPIIFLVFWIGLYPKPFLQIMDASLEHLVETVQANANAEKRRDDHLTLIFQKSETRNPPDLIKLAETISKLKFSNEPIVGNTSNVH
jgi:hypothetical protein